MFERVADPGHAQDGDPDGAHGAQEVTELQGVVVHDAQHSHAGLVTRMVELQTWRIQITLLCINTVQSHVW